MSARLREIDMPEVVQRYQAGESVECIGDAVGVSGWTIRQRLGLMGVQRRPPRRSLTGCVRLLCKNGHDHVMSAEQATRLEGSPCCWCRKPIEVIG